MDSKLLPENIRKCLPKEDRAALDVPTLSDVEERNTEKLEKKLQEQVASLLRIRNIWFYRSRMDRKTTGPKGAPDFIFSLKIKGKGTPVAWECKVGKGQCTPEQTDTRIRMLSNGWSYQVIRTLDEAKRSLDEVDE